MDVEFPMALICNERQRVVPHQEISRRAYALDAVRPPAIISFIRRLAASRAASAQHERLRAARAARVAAHTGFALSRSARSAPHRVATG